MPGSYQETSFDLGDNVSDGMEEEVLGKRIKKEQPLNDVDEEELGITQRKRRIVGMDQVSSG